MTIQNAMGLMSGTSMDGIDVALLKTDGECEIYSVGSTFLAYPRIFRLLLKAAEYFVRHVNTHKALSEKPFENFFIEFLTKKLEIQNTQAIYNECKQYLLEHKIHSFTVHDIEQHSTFLHAMAINKLLTQLHLTPEQIDIIGYHGQTVLHEPHNRKTIQLGDAALLAKLCSINVVNQFRHNDLMHGGQGAPFAPLYHRAIAQRDNRLPCVIINCGGIANVTLITGISLNDIYAYDTGPGNGLLDNFVRLKTSGTKMMDEDGKFAAQGSVNLKIVTLLQQQSCRQNGINFYEIKPPKSLDINDLILLPELQALSIEDGCATLTHFTIKCIVDSLQLLNSNVPANWILAGGGFNNPQMIAQLKQQLTHSVCIFHAKDIGWDADGLEAEVFAYLAVRSLKKLPLSLPTTTGVKYPVSGGVISKL